MRALILVGLLIPACGGNVDSPGTLTGNGGSSVGINSSAAGYTGVGGDCICDARADTGGTTSAGGTTSTGGNQATGCTGSFETIQSTTGLCVAKMATISAPSGYSDYQIDVTEVTKGQYDSWLATNPPLPESTDPNCGYVATYVEQGTGYMGTDADNHPVVYVDWCDAYAYCSGVGKRLCGAIGGGTNAFANYADAALSQWYRACTSGGANTYPYLGNYQSATCNGAGLGKGATTVVGSLAGCQTPAPNAGVYDLSGNVWEWEDSCNGNGQSALCYTRGGAFYFNGDNLTCGNNDYVDPHDQVYEDLGFRCCSR